MDDQAPSPLQRFGPLPSLVEEGRKREGNGGKDGVGEREEEM
jgi:hypothetical protein